MFSALREAIAADHDAIEKTPYAAAMAQGSIGREDYLLGLVQLYHVHAALEVAVAQGTELKPFFTSAMARTPAIKRDLAHFGRRVEDYAVLPQTQAIATEILRLAKTAPHNLLAHIYVLEGSRMGSLVLTKPIAQALQVQPEENCGIDYHVEGARETPLRLRGWKEAVGGVAWGAEQEAAIKSTAARFMHALCQLYAALPVTVRADQRVA
jgi:heme oxygenase